MKKNNYLKNTLKLAAFCTCFCLSLPCVYADPPETEKAGKNIRCLSSDIPTNFDGTSDKENSFFSFISRLRYVNRWALFKNNESEDLADHSAEVAFLAHALAVIKNKKFGGKVNAERAALLGLYHDTPELITGDMPSPVKYFGTEMKPLYDKIEQVAVSEMISMLPEEFKDDFRPLLSHTEEEKELWQIVKNADILSALIKCLREKSLNNPDFNKPLDTITEKLKTMSKQYPEVDYFIKEFMPAFGFTIA
ncbi:MAG: 5'-deoxynucleotidase [Clostridia bacterium]|nr:5'-deoxynucleotidase [Clostridia bacterium]